MQTPLFVADIQSFWCHRFSVAVHFPDQDANLPTVPESPKSVQQPMMPAAPGFKRPRLACSQGLNVAGTAQTENAGLAVNCEQQDIETPFQPSCQGEVYLVVECPMSQWQNTGRFAATQAANSFETGITSHFFGFS